ncbi:MAG TPA: hypothetical protein VEB63_02055 [Chitinophagaceae bacterium]|nr:hypothetical protein [Chitinophagaceae bacterium]
MQKVVVLFNSPHFDARDYEQVWDALRAAGHSHPKGLLSHVGFANPEGGWTVVDVWESAEAFTEFGKTLFPIIQRVGKPVPEPRLIPAHYVYEPETMIA